MREVEESPAHFESHSAARPSAPFAFSYLGIAIAVFICHAVWLSGVSEDAFITFRYAQNLAAGHGLVWNVGEAPVEGYTNFLWLLLSAGILKLAIDLPLASQVMGFLAGVATLAMVHRCATRLLGFDARTAWVPCLFLAFSGPFATWAGAGLETSLFTALVLSAVYGFARHQASGRSLDLHATLTSCLLASLTRPEGVMLAGLLLGLAALSRLRRGRFALDSSLGWTLVYLAAFGLYFVWRWSYFGYPLPNTFYAKTGGGASQLGRGLEYTGLFFLHFVTPWLVLVALALSRGAAADRRGKPARRRLEGARPMLTASALLTLIYSTYVAVVGGDYMAMYRFFVPVLPFLALFIGLAFERARRAHGQRGALLAWAGVVVGLLGSGLHSTPFESALVAEPEHMHGNYRGVELERWYVARHRLIGEFFARYGREGESLATNAIGGVAYYSGLRIFDVHGIVDPYIAHQETSTNPLGSQLPGHQKSDYVYLFGRKPTFYMFNRKLFEQPLEGIPRLVDEVDEAVARDYRVGSIWLEDPVNGEAGYFAFLERRDRPRRGRPVRKPSAKDAGVGPDHPG